MSNLPAPSVSNSAYGSQTETDLRGCDESASGPSQLLIFEGINCRVVPLPNADASELIIGRAPEAPIQIGDPAASRRHAALRIREGQVECLDLHSHNGTRVNGERILGARTLVSGDEISICNVKLVFHSQRPLPLRREIGTFTQLRLRLRQELDRRRNSGQPANLVCMTWATEPDRLSVSIKLDRCLRSYDFAAWDSASGQLWLLIPDLLPAELSELWDDLLRTLSAADARAGYATCPADGSDGDTLLSGARGAALVAAPCQLLSAGAINATRKIAGRDVIISDPKMVRIYAQVDDIAPTDLPVLIHGETGAGKELVAQSLHERSRRKKQPIVALNCAAFQDTLLENELFGHERGGFTGAVAAKPGLLEQAHGGTLFLDEVAELSPNAQIRLLRVLETQRFLRVGGVQERAVDIRLVAATHQNLEQAVAAGRFRKDLFYRLRGACIVLPPLRERPRELPLLARAFLRDFCHKLEREPLIISDEAMERLSAWTWPGNIRELRSAMEFVAATAEPPLVQPWHLPAWIVEQSPPHAQTSEPANAVASAHPQAAQPADSHSAPRFRPITDELRELEQRRMAEALHACDGVQLHAAELIRMPPRTFYLKVKQYGLVIRPGSKLPEESQ